MSSPTTTYYRAEYSKTDRSSCKKCKNGIRKDECRISKNSPSPFHDGFVAVWFHVNCFFIKEKGKLTSSSSLKGFEDLRISDQVKISNLIGKISSNSNENLSSDSSPVSNPSQPSSHSQNDTLLDPIAKENNKRLWAMKDKMEKEEISNKQLKTILDLNKMPSSGGRQDLVNRVSDSLLFGVASCPICSQRDMWWSQGQYFCKAETSYGLCAYKGLPKYQGGKIDITQAITDKDSDIDWIRDWSSLPMPREKRAIQRESIKEYQRDSSHPLRSIKFACAGLFLDRKESEIQQIIQENGGYFANDIEADVDYVISTYEDVLRATHHNNIIPSSQSLPISEANGKSSNTSSLSSTLPSASDTPSLVNLADLQSKVIQKLKMAFDLKLAVVCESVIDSLIQSFGFDQYPYLLCGNLPPIAFAKLSTPASVFPTPLDTNSSKNGDKTLSEKLSSISMMDDKEKQQGGSNNQEGHQSSENQSSDSAKAAKPVKAVPFWVKKPTGNGELTARGVVDNEAKLPNGVVYREALTNNKSESEDSKDENGESGDGGFGSSKIEFESMKESKQESKKPTELYDRMLSSADVISGQNKFYRLQLIDVNGKGKQFVFFTRWGRIGEPGNWTKSDVCSISSAKQLWEKKWQEKTKNQWSSRANFEKKPGAYFPVETEEVDDQNLSNNNPSSHGDSNDNNSSSSNSEDGARMSMLDPKLRNLVDMIFDTSMLEKSMKALKIDVKKMPLGAIRRNTLIKGYAVLKEIEEVLLSTEETHKFKLPALSSQFYTIIAHDFGRNVPEIIDNFPLLKLKMKQVETLLDIMIAAQLLNEQPPPLVQSHPSDLNYKKLGVDLVPLNTYTREYKTIQRFVNTGYNPTSLGTSLTVLDAFKVVRPGEIEQFEPHREKRPRKLLWHGSRVCNFVGILKSGLRIAPPEAPASGYMFGKAIYLSDLIEKSAPYCHPDPDTKIGLMLLCEAALGEALELNKPEYITQLPDGKNSAKALARLHPDPTKHETGEEKMIIPIGAPVSTNLPDVFLDHSEYMIYDATQVKIKYLVQIQFSSADVEPK